MHEGRSGRAAEAKEHERSGERLRKEERSREERKKEEERKERGQSWEEQEVEEEDGEEAKEAEKEEEEGKKKALFVGLDPVEPSRCASYLPRFSFMIFTLICNDRNGARELHFYSVDPNLPLPSSRLFAALR